MMPLKSLLEFELRCISSVHGHHEDLINFDTTDSVQSISTLLLSQNYDECLKECVKTFDVFKSFDTLHVKCEEFIEKCTNDIEEVEREIILFSCAISCLQLFVQINWTGPLVEVHGISEISEIESKAKKLLSQDNDSVYHLVEAAHYLYSAETIFDVLLKRPTFQTCPWWLFRCLCIHGQLIGEKSETLFNKTMATMEVALSREFVQREENKSYLFQIHIEFGLLLLNYYQYKQADEHFEKAKKLTGVDFGFTGALGMRTKFQQKPVSQLQVLVKRTTEEVLKSTISVKPSTHFPKNLSLDDETLLEKVKLVDENDVQNPDLCPEEYAMILAACTAMQKTNPAHRLKQEKIQAVIEFLLNVPSCWCVHTEALRLRCLNEKDRSRTVERSMTQLDSLVSTVTSKQSDSQCRLDLFYCIQPPPMWNLQKDLAKLYISLGAVSSALQIYERLEMWEDAIVCLIRTEQSDKAIAMINQQLEINQTPNLWCLLGDILQNPKHYIKAWELSKFKSNRAMTALGYYHISQKEFSKAVDCFQKSLSILSLQTNTWFTMGCALLSMEDYQKAADAFRRCVNLDWDNYEAWTNLSAAYVRCGKKEQAYKALSEAIKCNFDKWQLWENYVAVCTDVGQFREAISAYNRLLDLRNKYVDIPILTAIVRAICEDIPDASGNPGSAFKSKGLELFGHLTSKVTNDFNIWNLYATLYGDGVSENSEGNEKSIQYLHKAIRTGMQKSGWDKDGALIEKLIEVSSKISSACTCNQKSLSVQTLSSLRLTVNGFAAKLKQREKSIFETHAQDQFKKYVAEVENYSDHIKKLVEENKSS